jgi:hypothetical protein
MGEPVRGREGVALVLVLLLILALQLLAHGSLVLARQEMAASEAARRLLQARVAAEAGLNATPFLDPSGTDTVGLWSRVVVSRGSVGWASHETRVTRLDRELWRLEGWGQVENQPWSMGLGRVIWIMDPVARVGAFGGVVQVGPEASVDLQGDLDASDVAPARAAPDPRCAPFEATLDSLFLSRAVPGLARDTTVGAVTPALGLLGPAELAERMGTVGPGAGTPSPSEVLGRCVLGDPWNWGDPTRPDRPCGTHWVAAWSPGGLRVVGGMGQGLLAVAGDLELDGARFDGVVLVGGQLHLLGGAELVGFAQAAGGVTVAAGSRARGSACASTLALDAARAVLGGPVLVPGGWIGPLEQ